MEEFVEHRGAIGKRYLNTLISGKARYCRNAHCVVFIKDDGSFLRRNSNIRVQSLDIITKIDHRKQGHAQSVLTSVIMSLVSCLLPPPFE